MHLIFYEKAYMIRSQITGGTGFGSNCSACGLIDKEFSHNTQMTWV